MMMVPVVVCQLRIRWVLERFQFLGEVGLKGRLGRIRGRDAVTTWTSAVARVATGSRTHHIIHRHVHGSRWSGRARLHRPRWQRRDLSAVAHERDDAVAHLFKLFRFGVSDFSVVQFSTKLFVLESSNWA